MIKSEVKIKEALGQSDSFLKTQEQLSRVASINRPVLIIGERGTGKELAATRLHYLSNRWQQPFVTLNCASLSPSLLESELFGHEAGAFTGATGRRKGRFEMANEGTLFLDEIGNMPMIVQEKILRIIEYSAFERVGGSSCVIVEVRIIAATNLDLPHLAQEGLFKRDLLDRLSFEVIKIPPLRERKDDIILLATHFAAQMAVELKLADVPVFSDDVINQLLDYQWPGNIRELKNVIERAVYRSDGREINSIDINPFQTSKTNTDNNYSTKSKEYIMQCNESNDSKLTLPQAVSNLELNYLRDALEKSRYNQRKAADFLGLTYHQFRGLYRKYKKVINEFSLKSL